MLGACAPLSMSEERLNVFDCRVQRWCNIREEKVYAKTGNFASFFSSENFIREQRRAGKSNVVKIMKAVIKEKTK